MNFAQPAKITKESKLYTKCVESPLWICQHKINGQRGVLTTDNDGNVTIDSKNLKPIKIPIIQPPPPQCQLDGEVYAGSFFAFDCLRYKGIWINQYPLEERLTMLASLRVMMVAEIYNKTKALQTAKMIGSEGVVFKHLGKPYPYGSTVNWLKVLIGD
jgi:ATP-dependent DNA ligase